MNTLNGDLERIKRDAHNFASSKVKIFCYTEQSYQGNSHEGITEIELSREQNIPLPRPETHKNFSTVLDR